MTNGKHEIACELASKYSGSDMNEADTRHKIIDEILHGVLGWPKELVKCEKYINPGYSDYLLEKRNGNQLLFIEAKKEGISFELPNDFNGVKLKRVMSVKTLLTNEEISSAINQVRTYCLEEGCEFGSITNGHQWIFFKIFEKGKNWKNLRAIVIKSLDFFCEEYIDAINLLGFESLSNGSLEIGLKVNPKSRETFLPKDKISIYEEKIIHNTYSRELRPIVSKYFGVLDPSQQTFMADCYVSNRGHKDTSDNVKDIIVNSLAPYLKDFNVKTSTDNSKGGTFGKRILQSLDKKTGEVLVLFGSKGSGKSTFVNKLLYHEIPKQIIDKSIVVIIDLLKTAESKDSINSKIWDDLIGGLDVNNLLSSNREELIKLFEDRYLVAIKQDLAGLEEGSTEYNITLNKLIADWKKDLRYCCLRLTDYWKRKFKGVTIVIDNTDQLKHDLQDFCFTTAQEISDLLNTVVIISMREERFYASNIHGTLDAYQNSGFHINPPVTKDVFFKRVKYILNLFDDADQDEYDFANIDQEKILGIVRLFKIFEKEFSNMTPLNEFLSACTHGNIRVALEIFRDYVVSGYNNIEEMVGVDDLWTIKIHQVLKPVMIPNRFFYDESKSKIPNIYQVRSSKNGSHFTGLRILEKLTSSSENYVSINEVRRYFDEVFDMVEDFQLNLDHFLKHDLIESNNRIDYYDADIDRIRITVYGKFFLESLSKYFTYVELISNDCRYFQESTANQIVELCYSDFDLFTKRRRGERVKKRLKKARTFINYLMDEENKENDFYKLDGCSNFSMKLKQSFDEEEPLVLKSAEKNSN